MLSVDSLSQMAPGLKAGQHHFVEGVRPTKTQGTKHSFSMFQRCQDWASEHTWLMAAWEALCLNETVAKFVKVHKYIVCNRI